MSSEAFRRDLIREKLLGVAEEVYLAYEDERERYEAAISTLHDTVGTLRVMLKEEKRRREDAEAESEQLRQDMEKCKEKFSLGNKISVEIAALRFELFEHLTGKQIAQDANKKENIVPNVPNSSNVKAANSSNNDFIIKALSPFSTDSVFEAVASGSINKLESILQPSAGSFSQWCKEKFSSVMSSALCTAAKTGAMDTAKALIQWGAAVIPSGSTAGKTALHEAAESGNLSMLDMLLSHAGAESIGLIDAFLIKPGNPRHPDTALQLAVREAMMHAYDRSFVLVQTSRLRMLMGKLPLISR